MYLEIWVYSKQKLVKLGQNLQHQNIINTGYVINYFILCRKCICKLFSLDRPVQSSQKKHNDFRISSLEGLEPKVGVRYVYHFHNDTFNFIVWKSKSVFLYFFCTYKIKGVIWKWHVTALLLALVLPIMMRFFINVMKRFKIS